VSERISFIMSFGGSNLKYDFDSKLRMEIELKSGELVEALTKWAMSDFKKRHAKKFRALVNPTLTSMNLQENPYSNALCLNYIICIGNGDYISRSTPTDMPRYVYDALVKTVFGKRP
jgi:hypothetical protein